MLTAAGVAIRVLSYVVLTVAALRAYRWMRTRSRLLSTMFAWGLIVRAVLGVLLFVISYFHLPVLESLQWGGGFWSLAVDARLYYDKAAEGFSAITSSFSSPAYTRSLAVWMSVVGLSPPSSVLFNVACYALASVLIVAAAGTVRMAAVALGAITVSPALIIFGTQPLKDSFCLCLVALTLAGVRLWTDGWLATRPRAYWRAAGGVLLLTVSVFLFAGIRSYVPLFLMVSLAVVGGWTALQRLGGQPRWRLLAGHGSLLVILWIGFAQGTNEAGNYGLLILHSVARPFTSIGVLDGRRRGFISTPGQTSVVPAEPPIRSGLGAPVPPGPLERVRNVMSGIALLFIPISALRALSVVGFSGGRGLLFITDIDTVVMDLAIAASLWVVLADRSRRTSPVVVFVLVFAGVMSICLAYVVTNFGTLFRLRLLTAMPLWMLPAFASSVLPGPRAGVDGAVPQVRDLRRPGLK